MLFLYAGGALVLVVLWWVFFARSKSEESMVPFSVENSGGVGRSPAEPARVDGQKASPQGAVTGALASQEWCDLRSRLSHLLVQRVLDKTGFDVWSDPLALRRILAIYAQLEAELRSGSEAVFELPFLGEKEGTPIHLSEVVRLEDLEPSTEQTQIDVALIKGEVRDMQLIAAVRAVSNLGLKEAIALLEGAPAVLTNASSREEGEALKRILELSGAEVKLS